jgi:hypothetical protein
MTTSGIKPTMNPKTGPKMPLSPSANVNIVVSLVSVPDEWPRRNAMEAGDLSVKDAIAGDKDADMPTPDNQIALNEMQVELTKAVAGQDAMQEEFELLFDTVTDTTITEVITAGFDTLIRDCNGDMVRLQALSEARAKLTELSILK